MVCKLFFITQYVLPLPATITIGTLINGRFIRTILTVMIVTWRIRTSADIFVIYSKISPYDQIFQ